MIPVTSEIELDEAELHFEFVRASGPGGQNVNKVATAVQLRFDAARSRALTPPILERLRRLAGKRMTGEGVVVIQADRHRSQELNRRDALARLVDLIARSAVAPRKRIPTRPSRAAVDRTRTGKRIRSRLKRQRRRVSRWDE
ncbi:MAG: alternative ribosome rescue aminoacyl-tRNA hydrolase ArfB [Desulfobacterales bacterium]